ncbi:hypothetical protein KFE25_000802 [Diacronema lutheri]|uniref:Molybdate-anion transporter n=1 Tax=Diacronema lutheri TaxID=2081491 RepID=A0A8J5XET1_DIALT|nr:hypothetical protein KFE25_000802 [Diacronema lutheri]|mmetsp:Transcript_5922/g.18571  ORF Transcript_5922/g.18571 Transcript_5922/m.18571 type:complete len:464 (-) Transcript_5922:1059-2450(-)
MTGSPYASGWGTVFFVSVAAAAALSWRSCTAPEQHAGRHGPDGEFRAFQRTYLAVYYLAMLADWLQGPYVYALYESYGFSSHDIAVLFVGGFGSSMLFGTFAGAAADRIGRKKCGLLYALLYILSCVTKHYKDYSMLMLGRILGGIATSLLFSTFESWLVCEHNARGYDGAWISRTFSLAYFGNSVAAILAGVLAEAAAELKPLTPSAAGSVVHYGGFTAPFDLSMAVLVLLAVALAALWNENYGSTSSSALAKGAPADTLYKALRALARDRAILLLGACISFFEGSMYVFVFKWTPTLSSGAERPPYGLIFSTFMVLAMCGSSIFGIASASYRAESILLVTFVLAAGALAIPAVSSSVGINFACFLLFETCVGAYFPAMGMLKSQLVPEEVRATVYNIFRIPLNLIVLGVLLNSLSQFVAFSICGAMLALAGLCMRALSQMHVHGYSVRSGSDPSEEMDNSI